MKVGNGAFPAFILYHRFNVCTRPPWYAELTQGRDKIMGIESQYLGEINIPEEHRAEYRSRR